MLTVQRFRPEHLTCTHPEVCLLSGQPVYVKVTHSRFNGRLGWYVSRVEHLEGPIDELFERLRITDEAQVAEITCDSVTAYPEEADTAVEVTSA